MTWHTPPENQGQIVTVSYGWQGGAVLRRTEDASDRSVVIRRISDPWGETEEGSSQALELEEWDAWNSCPPAWLDALLDEAPEVTVEQIRRWEDE